MDIYILHEGRESGPHSENAVRQLLKQGGIAADDLAWRNGMSGWLPLSEVLAAKSTETDASEPTPSPALEETEPATAKQKALLSYLGIALPAELSKDQAARMVNDVLESGASAERLTLWNEERLRLHPELFAAEIQAKKENRANHFFELCETAGAEYFNGIAKAHCQVLVGFLDVKFPHWDARESEAAEHYFFPAVAEKFPQLVNKQWRGKLNYAEGMKVASEIVPKSATSKLRRTATSPMAAIARGVVLGVVILGALYLGYRTLHHDVIGAPSTESAATAEGKTAASESLPGQGSTPPATGDQPMATSTASALPAGEPAAPPATSVAPLAALPADSTPPPVALPPPTATPDPAAMAATPPAMTTAPMAGQPGTEAPVPVPPPPATLPMAGTLPSAPPGPAVMPGAPPGPATPPAPAMTSDTVPAPPTPPETPLTAGGAKTNLLLTKAVEVPLAYGKIMLPAGTPVKLLSRQGAMLKVSYRNSVISVPVIWTDLE